MSDETKEVKAGNTTSEFGALQNVKWLSWVSMIVGFAMTILPQILTAVEGTAAATYVGGAIMVVGFIGKVLATIGYNNGRVEVKKAASAAEAVKAKANGAS